LKKNFQTTKLNNNSIIEQEKEREKPVYEYDKSNNRSNSMINAEHFTESTMKFYSEKNNNHTVNTNHANHANHNNLEQKFMREKQLMNQKIKKHEIDMIDKYSKLFKFNNEESIFFEIISHHLRILPI
jgi:hypothetical protein